jgi:hypothetical protein
MKFKNSLLCVVLLLAFSCSNLSKNIVQESNLYLKNGTYSDKAWKDDLIFQKHSWFHELTLQFDFMLAHISPQSAFNFWFTKDELDNLAKCEDSRIVMAYSFDTKVIAYSSLYEQLEKNGYTRFEIPGFKKQLLQHPDATQNSFKLYHVFAICKKLNDHKPLIINFPGYLEKLIN